MNENYHDVPDHIAAEPEFASYLIAEQLKGNGHGSPPAEPLSILEKRFLTEHFHKWASVFFSRVAECSSAGFYQAAALMRHQFIEWDTMYLGRL